MKLATAAVKRVRRPEKQLMYLLVGRFLDRSAEVGVVLDLGCGPMPLAGRVRARQYIGVDLNEEMLREGAARHPEAIAVCSTIEGLHEDVSGDLVVSLQCIGISSDFVAGNTLAVVERMVRATRPGGALVFNVGPLGGPYFEEIGRLLRDRFRSVEVVRYGRFHHERSHRVALLLAYAMSWISILARTRANPRRLYICKGRHGGKPQAEIERSGSASRTPEETP